MTWPVPKLRGTYLPLLWMCCAVMGQPRPGFSKNESLMDTLELGARTVFHLAFEKGDNETRVRYVWIATSDGLYRYDGYNTVRFGKKDGLPSDLIRTVFIARNNALWVGTDNGAGIFDGKVFSPAGSGTELAGPNVRRILQDRQGTIWFCSDSWPKRGTSGGLTSLRYGVWKAWHAKDGLPSDYVVDQFTDSQGRIFALTMGGPARLSPTGDRWIPERIPALPNGEHWGSSVITEIPGAGVVLSNGAQVWALRDGDRWVPLGKPPSHPHGMISTRDGRLLIVGDVRISTRALFEWTGERGGWKQLGDSFPIGQSWGIYFAQAPDDSLWYTGPSTLQRWDASPLEWQQIPGDATENFLDSRDVLWSYQFNGMLAELMNGKWVPHGSYRQVWRKTPEAIWAVAKDYAVRWEQGRETRFPAAITGIADAMQIAVDGAGTTWIIGQNAQGHAAVAEYDGITWRTRELPHPNKIERVFEAPARQGGIWYLHRDGGEDPFDLTFINTNTIEQYPVPTAAVARFQNRLVELPDGEILVAGEAGLHRFGRKTGWRRDFGLRANTGFHAVWVTESNVWLTNGGALGGKDGLVRIDLASGQTRAFPADAIAEFHQAADGTLLTGGRGKVYVIPPGHNTEPSIIQTPDGEPILTANRDRRGRYFIGTGAGISIFLPDGMPPETRILANSTSILSGQPFSAVALSRTRFGATDTGSNRFTYSWRLDDGPWTPFQLNNTFRVEGKSLSIGRHKLAVRSRDNGLEVDATPAESTFDVSALPIQDRPWFAPGLMLGVILLGFTTLTAIHAHRKLAAEAGQSLMLSAKRYRQIVESAQEGLAVIDAHGICTLANQEFARIYDRQVSEIVGRHFSEFTPPEIAEKIRARRQAMGLDENDTPFEVHWIAADGQERWVSVRNRIIPTTDDVLDSKLVTLSDITARKTSDEAIRRSEANYRLLFESSPNAKLIIDRESFLVRRTNQAAIELYGYSEAEFRGLDFLQIQLPEAKESAIRLLQLPAPRTVLNRRHFTKDGRILEVEAYCHDQEFEGRPCRHITIVDKTAQRRAARQLEEKEAALSVAQQVAHVGSFEVYLETPPEGEPRRKWSDEMHRLVGLVPGEATQEQLDGSLYIHPDDLRHVQDTLANLQVPGQDFEYEYRVIRTDGQVRWLRSRSKLEIVKGRRQAVGIAQDITEYRHMQEQLQQSQRLDSIGRLAGGIAHDFNNLLTVINGYSKLILQKTPKDSALHEDVLQIAEAGQEAAELTRRLLAFGKKQVLKPSPLDLNTVIDDSLVLLRRVVGSDIRIETHWQVKPAMVLADAVQLNQLLLNLTTNAKDAMPRGGLLRFTTRATEQPNGPSIQLTVADNGIGMSQETLRQIFDPFFTTKERSGGTGLGLASVYGIVHQSGGSIQCTSEPARGTRFDIYLPWHQEPAAKPAVEPAATLAAGVNNRKVLVVDDQPEVRRLVENILNSANYDAVCAASGEEALAVLENLAEPPALLLTDIAMPGMNGVELAERVKQMKPSGEIVVLFMSGFSRGKLGTEMAQANFLDKPFTPDDLLAAVASALSLPVAAQ